MRAGAAVTAGAVCAALLAAATLATAASTTAPGRNGRIAFNRYRYREDTPPWSEIFVVNPNGRGLKRITHAPKGYQDDRPDWAPDGSGIVFMRCAPNGGRCAIWSVSATGARPRRLSPRCIGRRTSPRCVDDSAAVYSPNGKRLAFSRFQGRGPSEIVIADTKLHHLRLLTIGTDPGWSPSGRQLVFARSNDPETGLKPVGGRALFVVNANGSRLRRLTPWALKAGDRPDWSPDGAWILFRTIPNGPGDYSKGNLYAIRPDGTELRQLTHFPPTVRILRSGSYSPDGSSIVFATTAGATRALGLLPDLFVMSADGTDIRPLTRSPNWDGSPVWGPRP